MECLMPHLESQLMTTRMDAQLREPWEQIPNPDCAHSVGEGVYKRVALSSGNCPFLCQDQLGMQLCVL